MSDVAGELSVEISGRDVNLTALLSRIEQQLQRAESTGRKAGEGIGEGVGGGAQRASSGMLSLQQAQARLELQQARLAKTQGDATRAAELEAAAQQRLTSALAAQDTTTVQTINAQRQLAQIQTQAASGGQGLTGVFSQMGGTLGGLASAAGPVAAGFIALQGAQKALDFAESGAKAELTRTSFDALATQAGTTGDALLAALQKASGNQISDLNLELAANRAQMLGVAKSAGEFSTLLEIARDRAQKLGTDTGKAFDDLVTGLGRGSPLILDNLGIMVSVEEANKTYAASLGKTASALTSAEQKQALINAVLEQGRASIAATGGAVDGAAASYDRLAAAWENARNKGAALLGNALAPVAGGVADVLSAAQGTPEAFGAAAVSLTNFQRSLTGLPPLTEAQAASMRSSGQAITEWLGFSNQATGATQQNAAATQAAAVSMDQERQAVAQAAAAQQAATAAAAAHTQSLQDDAAKALLAAANSDELSQAKSRLQAQAQAAAAAVLQGGGNIAATAARLASSSSQVDVLTAAYIRLAQAQQVATNQRTQAFDAANRGGRITAAREAGQRIQEQQALKQAEIDRINQTGSAAQKLNLAQEQYAAAVRRYGADSVEAYRAQTAVINAQEAATKKGSKAAGVKLSDQQRLNNSLLADQDKFNDQVEDADLKHAQARLKIETDFQEKLRQAQDQFDQERLDGRAGFYANLGGIEGKGAGTIQKAASAAYEAASVEAGKIAQEKGADVAEKYMAAQEQIISARAKRQADIEKAVQDKDKAKATYLRGVDALYQQAEDAKLAKLKQGEGSLAAQRDKALQDENRQYEEAQGKIAESADRAAERKIAAAERAGKAIDAELVKTGQLADTYDRIAAVGSGATPTTGTATPATSTTAAAASGQPSPNADVVAALSGAQAAIVAALGAVERASKDTAGAVRGLKNSGGIAG